MLVPRSSIRTIVTDCVSPAYGIAAVDEVLPQAASVSVDPKAKSRRTAAILVGLMRHSDSRASVKIDHALGGNSLCVRSCSVSPGSSHHLVWGKIGTFQIPSSRAIWGLVLSIVANPEDVLTTSMGGIAFISSVPITSLTDTSVTLRIAFTGECNRHQPRRLR